MIRKLLHMFATALIVITAGTSCREDIGECPNKLCIISGGWKLSEVRLDGVVYNEDFSQYQLVLSDPSPSSDATSSFQRVNIGGTADSGSWSIENTSPDATAQLDGSVLRLRPSDRNELREDWEIESFTPREMVLVLHRDTSVKDGPSTIRFVLVRF